MITVSVCDVKESLLVFIQDNCTSSVILGANFLYRFKCVEFNFERAYLRLKAVHIPCFGVEYYPETLRGLITTHTMIGVPSRSRVRFQLLVLFRYLNTDVVYFEPHSFSKNEIYFAAGIIPVRNGCLTIEAINTGNDSLQLPEGMAVGKIKYYNDVILSIYNPSNEHNTTQFRNKFKYRECIEENIKYISKNLSKQQQDQIIDLIAKFPNLLATGDKGCGRTDLVEHPIVTESAQPVCSYPFRTSPKEK